MSYSSAIAISNMKRAERKRQQRRVERLQKKKICSQIDEGAEGRSSATSSSGAPTQAIVEEDDPFMNIDEPSYDESFGNSNEKDFVLRLHKQVAPKKTFESVVSAESDDEVIDQETDDLLLNEDDGEDVVDLHDEEESTRVQPKEIPVVGNFSVINDVVAILTRKVTDDVPKDADEKFMLNNNLSKKEVAIILTDFCNRERLTFQTEDRLMDTLYRILPEANHPSIPAAGGRKSSIRRYAITKFDLLKYDVCIEECCAFVGDNSTHRYCSTCGISRYYPCREKSCRGKSKRDGDTCMHSRRVSRRSLYYRPIIPLIDFLLQLNGFIDAISCSRYRSNEWVLTDILDGSVAAEHMAAMELNFEQQSRAEQIPINLLFSLAVDGASVYRCKTQTFTPLILSILNLPPNFRNLPGVGMFLLSVLSGASGSAAETFLYSQLIMPEVIQLFNGVELQVNQTTYFVQGRIILHVQDTKGIEKEFKVQSSASYAGCFFCNAGKGTGHNDTIRKLHYIGSRQLLPQTHFLRFFGQSQTCCPAGYYEREPLGASSLALRMGRFGVIPAAKRTGKVRILDIDRFESCDQDADLIRGILREVMESQTYDWYHACVSIERLQTHLYYHHCEVRRQLIYEIRSHASYLRDLAALLRDLTRHHVNGVKGKWWFADAPYADIGLSTWELFHVIYNLCKKYTALLKGSRSKIAAKGLLDYCTLTDTFPCFTKHDLRLGLTKNKQKVIKELIGSWRLHADDLLRIDVYLDNVRVPLGCSNEFDCKNLFRETGNFSGSGYITFYRTLSNFMYSRTSLPDAHKDFLVMFSDDLNDLLQDGFREHDAERIFMKVVETKATSEGIFPPSESALTSHQIIDLPRSIPHYGALKNMWALPSERAHVHIKKSIPRGGQRPDLTLAKRILGIEMTRAKEAFSITAEQLLRKKAFGPTERVDDIHNHPCFDVQLIDGNAQFYYNMNRVNLFAPFSASSRRLHWSKLELAAFLSMLISEVEKQCDDELDGLKSSGLFRLFYYHKAHGGDRSHFLSFIETFDPSALQLSDIDLSDANLIKEQINSGCCLRNDITFLLPQLRSMSIEMFKRAIVYGVKMDSTSCEYRVYLDDDLSKEANKQAIQNQLATYWDEKQFYSSWCKHRSRIATKFGKDGEGDFRYGIIDGYFRIPFDDGLLHGVPIAAVTSYNISLANQLVTFDRLISSWEEVDISVRFVPVTDIIPTPILNIPFDESDKVIPKTYCTVAESRKFVAEADADLHKLVLLPLHPSRARGIRQYDRNQNSKYNGLL